MDEFNDWVIQPSDQRNYLKDCIDLILDFNAKLNQIWFRNIKMSEQFLIGKIVKNYRSLYVNNKKIFFVCVYKIFNITKKIIEKNIEEKLGHENLPVISNKYNKICKKADMNQ